MTTYFYYYAINKAFDEVRYTTIVENVLNPMIETIVGTNVTFTKDATFEAQATAYIMQNGAMTEAEVVALKNAINK